MSGQNKSADTNFSFFKSRRSEEKVLNALRFPDLSYEEFGDLPLDFQRSLIARNRIVNTDTYNRTMGYLSSSLLERGEEGQDKTKKGSEAIFTLQLRRSPFKYLVASGIEDMVAELVRLPITQEELDFAKEHYSKQANVKFFNVAMWQRIIDEYGGHLPLEISGVRDGTVVFPGEPLLKVKGPEELIAHFEHVFHRVFYSTLVATRGNVIASILGDSARFIEVGKRGAINEEQHLIALKAAYLGGGIKLTSNDAGAIVLPIKDTGTIGHRYVQRFSSEEKAFRHAIELLDSVTLLVDLVDTYKGIDLALELKSEYRESGKKIWVRLDSGDVLDQTRYFLRKTKELGFCDPVLDKLVVEGIDSIEDIRKIERMIETEFGEEAKKRVVYGAGGLLISEATSRSDASSGFKISSYTDEEGRLVPTMKFSNSKGKTSYPGDPILGEKNRERVVAQAGEDLDISLFEVLYKHGELLCAGKDSLEQARMRVIRQTKILQFKDGQVTNQPAVPSAGMEKIIKNVMNKYGIKEAA